MESAFDVERVEWVPATAEALEVHVSGRWRDAAPDGCELIVVDAAGERRRFAAVAAAVDAASGAWHAAFAVPVELRSRLSAKLSLAAGERELTLPAASPGPAAGFSVPPPATVVEPTVLAQRRAAREGAADEGLVRRAQAAEATVSTLETQLDHLEARLRDTLSERDRLAARLRAAEQREEAERRVRGEAEDEREALRADVERQVAELRARARAAEEHAEALGAEMDEIRREAAEAQHAAAAARLAAERAGGRTEAGPSEAAQAELDRLGAEAGELARRLDGERALRAGAEAQLARQSERVAEVEATVTLLEHELDRRASVQTSVQGELEHLRDALALVRTQTEESASREGSAQHALAELQSTAAGLRERIGTLEASERAARNELRSVQAELAARGRDLERARIDVERSRAELASAHAAQDSTAAALREAERTIVAVRAEAAELQARLDDERRRRFEAEATLKAEMERERERWGAQIAEIEGGLHARIAAERHAFEEQAQAIEQLVVALRQRLASAGDELEERLAAAHLERDEALAERDAALADADRIKLDVAADLERVAAEREQLVARIADAEQMVDEARAQVEAARTEAETARGETRSARDETEAVRAEIDQRVLEVGAELAARLADAEEERDGLRAELDERETEISRLRSGADDAAAREAAIEALVADVVATAGSLRDGFDRQLGELHDRVEAELASLRAQLDEERTARLVAEEELAAERARGAEAVSPGILDALSRTELEAARRELASTQEALAAERRRSAENAELRAQASKLVADLDAAGARLKVRESEQAAPRAEAPTGGEVQPPPVDEPLEPEPGIEEPPAEAPEVEEPPADEPSAQEPPADEPLAEEPSAEEPSAEEAPADEQALAERPPLEEAADEAPRPTLSLASSRPSGPSDAELSPPEGASPLPTRYVRPSERPLVGWLTPAIARVADADEALAAELILELLPAQAGIVRDPLSYRLTIGSEASYRVTIQRDRTVIERQPEAGGADVHVIGPPAALAPLVAGGARRRMPGVRIEGRKRRLRKLLRARRAPLDFARLADSGVRPSPELALTALCAAVEPSWTTGHRFSVVYSLAGAEPLEVEVRDGRDLQVGPAGRARDASPAATISLRADALVSLLARLHLPHDAERVLVAGDRHAVALLHGWFDRAQGLPGG